MLHRNHLLPCDHLPLVTTLTQNATLKQKHQQKHIASPAERWEEHENDSESDDKYFVQVEPYHFRTEQNSHKEIEVESTPQLLPTCEKSIDQSETRNECLSQRHSLTFLLKNTYLINSSLCREIHLKLDNNHDQRGSHMITLELHATEITRNEFSPQPIYI